MKSPAESLLRAIYWVKFTHREECTVAQQHNLKYTRCCPAVAEAVRILEKLQKLVACDYPVRAV